MSTNEPTKRILTEIGEPDDFFGFTLGDLKLLIPSLFGGMIVVGNTPAEFRIVGWGIGVGMVLVILVLIYTSPNHLTTEAWLRARLQYLRQPSLLRLTPAKNNEDTASMEELSPEINDHRDITEREASKLSPGSLSLGTETKRTQDLTNIDRFHVAHLAGERDDGYVFGAVQVHPANMALTTAADWEQTVHRFGSVVNGIEFPFQIYSTDTPVDPKRITDGYRERLEDQTADLNQDFRTLLKTYLEKLPREFKRRGTSVREFYIIVYVSALDVHRDLNSVNETGILTKLEDLSYVGGFVTTLRASRRDVSPAEVEANQVAELDQRLTTIEEEISGLNGCSTTRVSTPELAALLKDFWEPGARRDDEPTPAVRSTPVVRGRQASRSGGES